MTTGMTPQVPNELVGDQSARGSSSIRSMRSRRRRRRISILLGALAVLLVLGAASVIWLVYRAEQIRTSLAHSSSMINQIQEDITAGRAEDAKIKFDELTVSIARAHQAGTDPLWQAAGNLPFVGQNFSAVTEVAVSADDIVHGAIAPLMVHAELIDWEALVPANGRIDIAPIERVGPSLAVAADTVRMSYERLSAINTSDLHPQIATPLIEVTASLEAANEALQSASAAAEILPKMLGDDGSREYLLLVQNNAEVRATGGIPGALAVVTASGGQLELTAQGSASSLGRFDPSIIIDETQASIYSTRMGSFVQSVNLTPDFPTAAQTVADMWERRNASSSIDGVIAIDPIALSYLLQALGPVDLTFDDPELSRVLASSGLPKSLTTENVVPTLLSDVYAAIEEPSLQDVYFAAVAAQVFDSLSTGSGDSSGLVRSLIRSADDGRLLVWSNDPDVQEVIASSPIAGGVTGSLSGGATFGAYFNDGTGAKMDFYMRHTVQLTRSCLQGGYLQYTLTATLTNTAPSDAADSLPTYVTGGGAFDVPEGTVQTNIIGYGPDRSQLQTARIDGKSVSLGSFRHGDRPVGVLTTSLAPGQTATVELDFTNVVQHSQPVLNVTPTVQPLAEVALPLQGDMSCE